MRLGMKRKKKKMFFAFIIFFITGAIISSHIFLKRVEPAFVAQTSNYSNTAFTDLVNKCVLNLTDKGYFSDLFLREKNQHETITNLNMDTVKMNRLISTLLIDIQNALNADYPAYVSVPLGSLSKYKVLSSLGPILKFKVIPISVVNSTLDEEFESAGINQVRHRIYLDLTVEMLYSGYTMHETELIEMSVPLAETVVMGEVPQYYGIIDDINNQ